MNIQNIVTQRYSTKAFDAAKKSQMQISLTSKQHFATAHRA